VRFDRVEPKNNKERKHMKNKMELVDFKRNTEKDEDENIGDILEFCHAYLAKAYEKKVGRA